MKEQRTDFQTGEELLAICSEEQMKIPEVMMRREIVHGGRTEQDIRGRFGRILSIMRSAVRDPVDHPRKSMGGLIGGEAAKVAAFGDSRMSLCGPLMNRMITYSLAVLEVNASMGLITAAPTAGSAGVLPAALLAVSEEKGLPDEQVYRGMLTASAIGYLLMANASVSGAEAGCQAEIGSASAMAAGALVELMGGSPEQVLSAAAMALANVLGLVCDPVAGLVEIPCQSRNVMGALNAAACAQMSLAGAGFPIPFDEMADAMLRVGKSISYELRETALGGTAATKTGCALKECLFAKK
jgi:L-serine dehydratase